ncbi:MAG: M20/M25/M40 family metallo-hydrolase [bacterium]
METERLFELLSDLILAPGVSGNEGAVASVVEARLAAAGIAHDRIQRDGLGNRWIRLGPAGEPKRVLIAHMDEIGFRITSIRPDGNCRVVAVGGIDAQLYEGAPVVVHTAGGPVPGAFAPVSHHVTFRTGAFSDRRLTAEDLILDVGARSPEELSALGVRLLDTVTFPKRIEKLAGGLVQARSLDDRFGCAALVAAASKLAESKAEVPVPTVFAWSVQEEVGLRGARALAHRFAAAEEVIAIDSFTVGAGPRDNKQFDSAKPGGGPVLRAFDGTTLVPDAARDALLEKARGLGFELQYGYMPGGNDASMFESSGSRVFGLSVPVVYSHTAAERIQMGDLARLVDLIAAWCVTWF